MDTAKTRDRCAEFASPFGGKRVAISKLRSRQAILRYPRLLQIRFPAGSQTFETNHMNMSQITSTFESTGNLIKTYSILQVLTVV